MASLSRPAVAFALILSALIAVSLFVNLAFFFNSPEYTYPDSDTYLVPANNMLQGRGFSDRLGFPDTLRTPGFPVAVAPILFLDGGIREIVLTQHALNVILTLVIFAVLWRLLDSMSAAALAALVFAIDPTTLRYSNRVLTETLFTALLFAVFAWLRFGGDERRLVKTRAALLGFASGVLALVRPASLLFFIPAAAYILIAWRRRSASAAAVFVVASLVIPVAWTARNYARTGCVTFCSIGATNLLLYRAAGVLAIDEPGDFRTNQTREQNRLLERADRELAAEYHTESPEELPHALQAAKYEELAMPILRAHPAAYVKLALRGYNVLLFENDSEAVEMAAPEQDEVMIRRVVTAYTWVLPLLALIGIVPLLRRDWRTAVLSLLTIGYFLTITAGGEAESRFRTPVVPQIALLAGASVLLVHREREDM